MKNKLLISLHLPKTAGNSFLKTLGSQFGENLMQDYSDMSVIQQYLAGNVDAHEICKYQEIKSDWFNYQCVHGHFMPVKYSAFQDKYPMMFITWLRDPVSRLISHYHFFKRSYDPTTAGPLFQKIIKENWSLARFCFSEEYKNLYSKYLWNFSYESFDFVGLTEFYEDDLRYFSKRFLKTELDAYKLNCAVDNKVSCYEIDTGLRQEVEDYHSKDMALYMRALKDREQRM